MRQGDFTGLGGGAAAGQARGRDGVVGTSEGAGLDEGVLRGEKPQDGVDLGDLQRLLVGERREDGGKALGQHALARARRPHQENVVVSRGGHLQGAFGLLLSLDVGEVRQRKRLAVRRPGRRGGEGIRAGEVRRQGLDVRDAIDREPLGEGGLPGVFSGDENRFKPCFPGSQRHGQYAGHGAHLAFQAQLAEKGAADFGKTQGARGRENAQEDGQIIECAGFSGACGGEVEGDMAHREAKAAHLDGGAHPFPGLLHRGVGQTNHIEAGKPGGDVTLHRNLIAVDALEPQGAHTAEHGRSSFLHAFLLIILYCAEKGKDNLNPAREGS